MHLADAFIQNAFQKASAFKVTKVQVTQKEAKLRNMDGYKQDRSKGKQ